METEISRIVMDNAPVIVAAIAPVAIDAIAGALPDRWVPYAGVCRRVVKKAIALYRKSQSNGMG